MQQGGILTLREIANALFQLRTRLKNSAVLPSDGKFGSSEAVGWHTLRHSLGTLMTANREDLKTV
jgi:hypothetical protein